MRRALLVTVAVGAAVGLSLWARPARRVDAPDPHPVRAEERGAPVVFSSTSPVAEPSSSPIRGRVLDALGNPLPGSQVLLFERIEHPLEPDADTLLARARTTTDGRFELECESDGRRVLIVRHPQFPTAEFTVPDRIGPDGTDLGDLRLESALGLAVDVFDSATGVPIAEALVELDPELRRAELSNEAGHAASGRTARSDALGRAILHGVEPGAYRLRVTAASRATVERALVRRPDGAAGPIRIDLPPGLSLSGRIVDESGVGVPGARVVAAARPGTSPERPGSPAITTVSGEAGAFRLTGLLAGPIRLSASAAGHGRATRTAEAPAAADLEIVLPPAAELRGRVVDAVTLAPIAGASVEAVPTDGFAPVDESGFVTFSARSDVEGNFRIEGLPHGRFTVRASSEGHVPARSAPLDAAPGRDVVVTLELTRAAVVRGRVLDAEGVPLPGAEIEAMDGSYDGSAWATLVSRAVRGSRRLATADADGRFELRLDDRPGERFRLRAVASGHAPGISPTFVVPRGIPEFEIPDVRLRRALRIRGVARDADGRPVPAATVCAEPVVDPRHPEPREGARGITAPDGRFRIGPLAPGRYAVFYYFPSVERAATSADRQAATETVVELIPGADLDLDLAPR